MEENESSEVNMNDDKSKENTPENIVKMDLDNQNQQKKENNSINESTPQNQKENDSDENKIVEEEAQKIDNKKSEKNQDNSENENKMDIESDKDKEKETENEKKEQEDQKEEKPDKNTPHGRSIFSLEGAKKPLSIYTRRVMDTSKISEYLKPDSSRGRIGGRNLGNTCFMNSSIACLSNTTELTYYFLKGDYLKDINEENRLGMQGELAKSWGELLNQYWVEDTRVGDPSDFKYTIGKKASRFRGYGQQDSNEFMSVFLDYLNEDLNKTTKKEYIEMKEKGENESDEECAKRFWECNLKRNDSIITDLFCGQFKSTITCPDCGWINITFDPFDTINLPLLTQTKKYHVYNQNVDEFNFYYVPKYCFRNPYDLKIKTIDRNELFMNVIDRIKKETDFIYHDKLNDLFLVDMYQRQRYDYPEKTESLHRYLCTNEYVFSYDFNKKEDEIKIPVYFWEDSDKNTQSLYPRMIFGKKNMSIDDIRKKIYFYLRKYILSPFLDLEKNEEIDNLSLEIEKYIEDKKLELNEDKLIELIEKEYQEIFNTENEESKEETKMDEEKDEKKENDDKNDKNEKDEKDENDKKDESNSDNKEENKEKEEEQNKKEEKKDIEMKDINNEEDKNKQEEKKDENEKKETKNEEKDDKEKNKSPKEKLLDNFIQDLPFKIYMRKEKQYFDNPDILFLDKQHFNKLPKAFKNLLELKSFKDTLDKASNDINGYEMIVEFNQESKYINKKLFKLDDFEEYSLEYIIKKKEEKKEGEEEDDGKMTLAKCLKKFCKEEPLEEGNEWYCSKCKKHVLAKKKMELYYLPKILIICFKRFVKDSYRWEKNDDEVEFPINDMDMKEFVIGPDKDHSKYDLFAVSQHYGSTGFGHYTAVCKNNGKWYSYNDSSCSSTSESDALSSAAYVLFYRRQTD